MTTINVKDNRTFELDGSDGFVKFDVSYLADFILVDLTPREAKKISNALRKYAKKAKR